MTQLISEATDENLCVPCCRALKGLPVVIRQDTVFDYLYVNDLAKITEWFIEHEAHYKAYNVCTGVGLA